MIKMCILSKLAYDLLKCTQNIKVRKSCSRLKGRLTSVVLNLAKSVKFLLL